jgi:hypothetical protein
VRDDGTGRDWRKNKLVSRNTTQERRASHELGLWNFGVVCHTGQRCCCGGAHSPIVWPFFSKKSKKVWRTFTPVHSPFDDIVVAVGVVVLADGIVPYGLEAK